MRLSRIGSALWAPFALVGIANTQSSNPTDSYRDADALQSGYLPNHNMDPAIVDSVQFGQLWKVPFNAKEQFYAKPLVFTPAATGVQILFLASSQNYIRTLNAKTGDILNVRQVHTPFLQSDIGCTDIPNTIGIIGTPIIDPATEIAYFFSKTYIPNLRESGDTGTANGVYYFHGVNVETLEDMDGYPILIDGSQADNQPSDYFVGGVVLQRPSLVQIGNYVYGGFGGHCDLFNYTGLIVGIDLVNKKIAAQWATMTGPLTPKTDQLLSNLNGGQAGIWQSGMGLSSDGDRIFFATGNGDAHENNGVPASGKSGCRTLGEAVVNLNVDTSTGKLIQTDYFQPYDYENMDGGDQDFGSGGVALLDPTVFNGTGINRLAVASGKNGHVYILNADNLGGYKLGPGGGDNTVQTIPNERSVFGGSASYPLEGGYIYQTPIQSPTLAYKLGFDGNGKPQFALAGQSNEISAGRVGVGIPTITSLNGQEGTAILWMTDPDAGIRAWYAVPGEDGTLRTIKLPQIGGINKFQRPAFGDTRLYTTDANGVLYCLGSPVNLPLNCSSPVNFGDLALGSQAKQTVGCTALIDITQISDIGTGDPNFVVHLADLPKGEIAQGTQFSFPVIWNLTNVVVTNAQNASFGNVSPGIKTTPLTITTQNGVTGYATVFPVSLTGNEVSEDPYLQTAPSTVDFGGIVLTGALANMTKSPDGTGDDSQASKRASSVNTIPSSPSIFTMKNAGLSAMVITGYAWTTDELDDPDINWTNATQNSDGSWNVGTGFTADLPIPSTNFSAGQSISVDMLFTPIEGTGSYGSYLGVWSTGGSTTTILEGSASTQAIANMSISTSEGGWLDVTSNLAPVMDFGYVQPASTQSLQIRLCNSGGSVLTVSKSKPPNGVFSISDPAELHEGQEIPVNDCAFATVDFQVNTERYNLPDIDYSNTWTLNTDDLNFGVHVIQIEGILSSHHVGPQNSTGQPVYTYLACFQDNTNGRLLPYQAYVGSNMTNGYCQGFCEAGKYIFEGGEYSDECYCANSPPPLSLQIDDVYCNFPCAGDSSDTCGGNYLTGAISVFYDSTRYTAGDNDTLVPGGFPIPQQVGDYTYVGCLAEPAEGRALSAYQPAAPDTGTTLQSCIAGCAGYQYAGTEYASQCFCADDITAGSELQASDDPDINGCSMFCQGNSSTYCGGANRLSLFQYNGSTPLTPPSSGGGGNTGGTGGAGGGTGPASSSVIEDPAFAGNYEYLGCYTDNVNGRALSTKENPIPGDTVTPDACGAACSGYLYFGLEYGQECYCSNELGGGSTVASGGNDTTQNLCSMACAGNSTWTCGGPNRLTVYTLNQASNITKISDPITVADFGSWQYLGCYTEGSNGRALSDLENPIPGNSVSVEACGAACSQYLYFGVEYAGECYCGLSVRAGSVLAAGSSPDETMCDMLCNGNSTEFCGGPNRLNLYEKASQAASSASAASSIASLQAAPLAAVANSTATGTTSPTALASTSSALTSLASGSASPSASAGVASGDNTLALTTTGTSSMASSVTSSTSSVLPTQNDSTSTSMTNSSASSTSLSYPTIGTLLDQATYLGCANSTIPYALSGASFINTTDMTLTACQSFCASSKYNYGLSGVFNGTTCLCGNGLQSFSTLNHTDCDTRCAGDSSQACGGAQRISVWNYTEYLPPTAVKAVGAYQLNGCFQVINASTLLDGNGFFNGTSLSVESCVGYCSVEGYSFAGAQNGSHCLCGSTLPSNATKTEMTECDVDCSGNNRELCGGRAALVVYQYNATSVAKDGSVVSVNEDNSVGNAS